MEIALISDNHSYVGDDVLEHLYGVDEIWHAGDMGSFESLDPLLAIAPVVGVYGNIDTLAIRKVYPLNQIFERAGLKIFMTHIGGYPGTYNARVKRILIDEQPNIYICGHSHICKVVKDRELNVIHMNPGAYGHHGFHKVRTMLKMDINQGQITNLRAIELGLRGTLKNDTDEAKEGY